MPPPPGPARRPVFECCRRAVEERAEASLVLRTDDRVGAEEHATVEQIARAAASATPVSIGFGEPSDGKERGAGDVAVASYRGCDQSHWLRRQRCCRPCASCRRRGASYRGRRDGS